ncbi:MAG: septal ring lytic transglycosylase RlpA family protein [Gammaproteobacteria bacterium]|nr:septal ring lytic transglycosylase RlpA family protein [Gammaproteobacteria bacterium]
MKLLSIVLLALLVAACGGIAKQDGPPAGPHINIASIPDAIPYAVPKSKYGNPPSYSVFGKRYRVLDTSNGYRKKGLASWYGTKFHGKRTSSGEPYDMYAMTAAHKSLPLPTFVRVTNLKNSKSIVVKVNDRGPFHKDRIIDLSYAAAIKLNIAGNGTGLVEVVALDSTGQEASAMVKKQASGVIAKKQDKNNLYIQIGAYAEQSNAQGVQLKLVESNINNVKISQAGSPQRSVFRVRVGPLVSVKSADEVVEKLNDLGYGESTIVVE